MKIGSITNIIQRLEEIKSNEIISTYEPLLTQFDSLISSISSLDDSIFSMYDLYFNENSIPNGEGLNLLKSNSFCDSIPKEYIYSDVRNILLDNITKISEGLYFTDHFKNSIDSLNTFVQNKQVEFNNWTPPAPDPSQTQTEQKSKVELFWGEEGLSEIQSKINSVTNVQSELKNKISSLNTLIQQWLDFGMFTVLKVAVTQNVFAFTMVDLESEDLFSSLDKNQISVSNYAPDIINALNIVKEVISENSEDAEELTNKIRDRVLNEIKVRETSESILNQIKNNINYLLRSV